MNPETITITEGDYGCWYVISDSGIWLYCYRSVADALAVITEALNWDIGLTPVIFASDF